MYTKTLQKNTKKVLGKLKNTDFIKNFYLSGGTALALQIGHRESEDLDFFSQKDFDPKILQRDIEEIATTEEAELDKGTLNCFIDGVQVQFLHYPYKLLEDKVKWQGVFLSAVLDIACTKLLTVSARGSKKDFVDIYFLLHEYDLPYLFDKLEEKYQDTDYNLAHILKSFVYFQDAESEPMPRMHKAVEWKEVKEEIRKKVKEYKV